MKSVAWARNYCGNMGVRCNRSRRLLEHASEAMTTVYLESHEVPWSDVETGSSLVR